MDHLIFVAPDLDGGVRHVEGLLGVEMSPGGRHDGFGTRNRLLRLGDRAYMEVLSVDPDAPPPPGPRWFGLDDLQAPRLASWCAAVPTPRADGLLELVEAGRAAGIDLGQIRRGRRARPDGSVIEWSMTDPWADRAGGVIPFFIDWGSSPHPADDLPAVCRFVGIRLEHPEVANVERWLSVLGLDAAVVEGSEPKVTVTLETPRGPVELV